MQKIYLDTVQIEATDGVVRNIENKANFHDFTCEMEQKTESLSKIVQVSVLEGGFEIGGQVFKEGDLMLTVSDWGVKAYAKINNKGELLIFGENVDRYSINTDGELIYTYCNE